MKSININDLLKELKVDLQKKMGKNRIIPSLIRNSQAFENWIQLEVADFLINNDYANEEELKIEHKVEKVGDQRGFDIHQPDMFVMEIKIIKSGWSGLITKETADFDKLYNFQDEKMEKIFLYFHYPVNDDKRKYLEEKREMLIADGSNKRVEDPLHEPQYFPIGKKTDNAEIYMDALLFH